jgi:uncharacterized protein YjiS (DUF1127 family)
MTMPSLSTGPEFIVARAIGRGIFIMGIDRCLRAFARILRLSKDRAWLEDLPDYLLRDIGIDRSEISSVVRFGSKDGRGRLWI